MEIIETIKTTVDTDLLRKILKKHAAAKEMPKFNRWLKRLEEDGTLFLRKRCRMTIDDYQSVQFSRFETFVNMATTKKHLTCKI